MKIQRAIVIMLIVFLAAGLGAVLFLPKEKRWNKEAEIKIGAGE